ncbi:MAG: hypothetical protein J0L87_11330 [Bacteroidetes bacterium]|nr:hypothetical protein [Bacteroidota bacterium]
MKIKNLTSIILMVSTFVCANHFSFAQNCKAKDIVKKSKDNIAKPYKYDSYAISEFTFTDKPQKVEVQFTAFQGQKYKLVFCSSGFEEAVTLNIYDKSNRVKKGRKKIYDNNQGIDNNFWSFEPPKSGNYFIEYELPASTTGKEKKGCVVMLIGFIDKGDKDE